MAQGPPPSDSEYDLEEYQYESEGEERLGEGARRLFNESGGNYRLARAALLAYNRGDIRYTPAPQPEPRRSSQKPHHISQEPHIISPEPRRSVTYDPLCGPPADEPTKTGLATPPPTGAESHQPPANAQQEHNMKFLVLLSKPETLLSPLLEETGMQGYFRSEEGVSRRTARDVEQMLRSIKADRCWLGDIYHVDTSAVGTVTNQWIHRPGLDVWSSTWYVVIAGTRVGIFTSWTEVAPLTQGVRNAIHRSWSVQFNAFSYFQHALLLGNVRLLPVP